MSISYCFFAETQLQFVWGKATIAARCIIFFLIIASVFVWYMMVSKALQMLRAKRLNALFENAFRQEEKVLGIFDRSPPVSGCPMFSVYQEGCAELAARLKSEGGGARKRFISLKRMEHVKRTLENAVARESLKLESGLILLAIAVSGAPFIGLPGRLRRADYPRGRFVGGHPLHVRL